MARFEQNLEEFKEYLRTHDGGYPLNTGPYSHPLGHWVKNIRGAVTRQAYKKEQVKGAFVLSAEQIESLNAIDFVWAPGSAKGMKRSARFYEIVRNEVAEASRAVTHPSVGMEDNASVAVSAPLDAQSNHGHLLTTLIGKVDSMMTAMERMGHKMERMEHKLAEMQPLPSIAHLFEAEGDEEMQAMEEV